MIEPKNQEVQKAGPSSMEEFLNCSCRIGLVQDMKFRRVFAVQDSFHVQFRF